MPLANSLRLLSPLSFGSLQKLLHIAQLNKPRLSLFTSTSVTDCGDSSYALVLCGKSSAEIEIAKSLKHNNNTLKFPDNNANVSITLHSEKIDKPVNEETFDIGLFMNSLSTNQFGRLFIWSHRLTSTHDIVSLNFSQLPIGSVCLADVQFKGRGRSKNVWESPKGCLMFSFTIQVEDGRTVPFLQYVVSLAVTEAIKDVCHKNGLPNLNVKIKWPNDLYLNGLKVGGILCTSTYKSKKFNVSAGIGLNIDNENPTTCLNSALRESSSGRWPKSNSVGSSNPVDGFQPLEELYYEAWLHSGQRVIVEEKNGDQVVENVVTIQGLSSSGFLSAVGDYSEATVSSNI
ncbi:hypothetical protein ACFE04_015179 [Oxalis oulophora]